MGAAAGNQLEIRIDHTHGPGGLLRQAAVLIGRLVAHLPDAVHLVAQAPVAHVVGLGIPVPGPQVAEIGAGRMVAVVQQIQGGLNAPGAQIDGHHGLRSHALAPGGKLVETHAVGFNGAPVGVQAGRTLVHGPDAVLPAIAGYEVAAGIPDDGHAQLPHELRHVLAEAQLVGIGMVRLIDAVVHTAAQMLNKGAEHVLFDRADHIAVLNGNLRLFSHLFSPLFSDIFRIISHLSWLHYMFIPGHCQ